MRNCIFNKNAIVLAWDFDLTLVDSFSPWIDYLNERLGCGDEITIEELLGRNGDLVPYFFERGIKNPFSYWEQHDLYDDMTPFMGYDTAKVIAQLSDKITNITGRPVRNIVVSKCVPQHIDSKHRFLSKWFPKVFDGFHDTAFKHDIRCHAMFDDSEDTLRMMRNTGVKLVVPASHNIFDVDSEDSNYIKFMGGQGKLGTFWEQLSIQSEQTKLALWITQNLRD